MLDALIKTFIRESGPISVAQFMQLALYDPKYGYYTTRDPFGRGGDFTTAPEISQLFGEMIGLWIADFWLRSGSPALRLIECGPGRGTLMQDILRTTRNIPQFHAVLEVAMIEISPRLKQVQQSALAEYPFIKWHPDLTSIMADKFTILIGNEFLDALPINQFVTPPPSPLPQGEGVQTKPSPLEGEGRVGGYSIRRIGLKEDELCFIGKGNIREECPALENIIQEAARLLAHGGACLFIDYGYADLPPPEGTLQAVKNHRYHPLFENIGEADITALVDFAALATHSHKAGLRAHPLLTQGLFLERMQIRARQKKLAEKATPAQKLELEQAVERLLSPTQMGTLFKVFCATSPNDIIPHGFD